MDDPGLRDRAQTLECPECRGQGMHGGHDGDDGGVVCASCNGKGRCRNCSEDGGCAEHGWGEALRGDEARSALASSVDGLTYHEVEDWVRGRGVRVGGQVISKFRLMSGLSQVLYDVRPTKEEKRAGGREVTEPHRCNGRPCADDRCRCGCEGCVQARRRGWARLGA